MGLIHVPYLRFSSPLSLGDMLQIPPKVDGEARFEACQLQDLGHPFLAMLGIMPDDGTEVPFSTGLSVLQKFFCLV